MNKIYNEDCLETMKRMGSNSIDLVITSPPYDNLRTYDNDIDKTWGPSVWEPIILELYRVIKKGGVIVWVVKDATIKGSKTGTSFRQALYAIDCGLRLHDTMIWDKGSFQAGDLSVRYGQSIEYMFVFSKGKPKTFNPIKDRLNKTRSKKRPSVRLPNGSIRKSKSYRIPKTYGIRKCIWGVSPCVSNLERTGHPAQMSEALVHDHIISWSNEGDIVYDPFLGSGTTAAACIKLNRKYLGSELNTKYYELANKRIDKINEQLTLF